MAPLEMLHLGLAELRAAGAILRRFPDQDLTLADAFGLHAIQSRNVRLCWSTDIHLCLMGVPLAIHARGDGAAQKGWFVAAGPFFRGPT